MLLKDVDDRSEELVNVLAEYLEREFPFFKELSRETADEAKFVSKIAKDHLTMVRTFEQRSLIEEGEFINKDGIYMVFDGFCGIYQQKRQPLVQIDAFGKVIIEESKSMLSSAPDEETKEVAQSDSN